MIFKSNCFASANGVVIEREASVGDTEEEAGNHAMMSLIFRVDPMTPAWLLSDGLRAAHQRTLNSFLEISASNEG